MKNFLYIFLGGVFLTAFAGWAYFFAETAIVANATADTFIGVELKYGSSIVWSGDLKPGNKKFLILNSHDEGAIHLIVTVGDEVSSLECCYVTSFMSGHHRFDIFSPAKADVTVSPWIASRTRQSLDMFVVDSIAKESD